MFSKKKPAKVGEPVLHCIECKFYKTSAFTRVLGWFNITRQKHFYKCTNTKTLSNYDQENTKIRETVHGKTPVIDFDELYNCENIRASDSHCTIDGNWWIPKNNKNSWKILTK